MARANSSALPQQVAGHGTGFTAVNEISCRITSSFIQYVRQTRPVFMPALLDGLPYEEAYLSDQHNWIPWEIEKILEDRLVDLYDDENIMFTIGRSVVPLRSIGVVNTVMNLFMTPERIIKYAPRMARFFTKSLVTINILESGNGFATVEVRIKGRQTRGACLFNQGLFSLSSDLFGLGPAEVTETRCCVSADELGQIGGKRYAIDENGNVNEYYGAERHGVPVGSLSDSGTFIIRGTEFGAESCVYRVRWSGRGRPPEGGDKERALQEAITNLEENHAKLASAYDRIYRSEEKYRTLIDSATDAICFLDTGARVQALNRKGVELFGYPVEEVKGRSVFDLIDESSREQAMQRFAESLKGDTTVSEVVVRKKSGERLVMSVNPTLIVEDGDVRGVMVIARDVTGEREMAAKLIEAERFAAKGIVAAEIAHEINNSLASIETGLFILDNIRVERPYRQDILREVKDEIERMSGIVRGILDVYRADTSSIQLVDINAEIEKVVAIKQRRLKGKGIAVVLSLYPGLGRVACYPGHIKQILLNLIKNAEEAMSPDRANTIEIATSEDSAFVFVKVSDTGAGISPDRLAMVSMPFYTSKDSGTGLGLAVCREIARKYGGDISIESTVGSGTAVTISFGKEH